MNILKKLRSERGLTLKQLAEESKVDQATISLLENDRRKAHGITLGKLAKALDVSIETLEELLDETATNRGKLGGRPRKTQTDDTMQADVTDKTLESPENQAA